MDNTLLKVNDLQTYFHTEMGVVRSVDGVSFRIGENETVGMVGESGCGKSVTALSIMRLIDMPGRIVNGQLDFKGENLLAKNDEQMRLIRGNEISMIFQEPMTSLNPVHTIGDQIAEVIVLHQKLPKREAKKKAIEMLAHVGIPSPEQRINEFPYQLSGGMRQRAMIAMALSCNPSLLIADEPTTALDVTIQAQILDLMKRLKEESGAAVLIITHDLGVIAEMADSVVVLYAGKVVEYADVNSLFEKPLHPYTRALLESIPRITDEYGRKLYTIKGSIPDPLHLPDGCKFYPRCRYAVDLCKKEEPDLLPNDNGGQVRCWMCAADKAEHFGEAESNLVRDLSGDYEKDRATAMDSVTPADQTSDRQTIKRTNGKEILLEAKNLKKYFPISGGLFRKNIGEVKAVDDINFNVYRGETLGIVGESGCGKTTTGRLLLRVIDATAGTILFEGQDIQSLDEDALRQARRDMQIIFQDPFASLNPRMKVRDIVGEAFLIHREARGKAVRDNVARLLEIVGLQADHMKRYPHQFSGGQRQRVGIARSLALNPKLIICDEPVSALDVSIQAQIVNLLEELQEKLGLTYLFIAHDLSVVKHIADRVAVMYLGKIVEMSGTKNVFGNPLHPYTEALLSAIPVPDTREKAAGKRIILKGDVPSPSNPPSGCHFHTRCPYVSQECKEIEPALTDVGGDHLVSCFLRQPQPAQSKA